MILPEWFGAHFGSLSLNHSRPTAWNVSSERVARAILAALRCSEGSIPEATSLLEALTRLLQPDIRINAERDAPLLTGEAVFETPAATAGGRDFQGQAAAIEKLHGPVPRLHRFNSCAREHGGNLLLLDRQGSELPQGLPP